MDKKIEVKCECPKSSVDSITSMTEAFFGLKPGTLSKTPEEKEDEYEGDRTAADDADAEPKRAVPRNVSGTPAKRHVLRRTKAGTRLDPLLGPAMSKFEKPQKGNPHSLVI